MRIIPVAAMALVLAGHIVAAPINVALQANGGSASQSSTYSSDVASRANDGDTNQNYYLGIAHTNFNVNAWWEVTFDASYLVSDVTAYFRTDCCTERNDGFNLYLYNGVGATVFSLLNQSTPANEISQATNINTVGARLRIELTGANYLQLGGVVVMGDDVSGVPEPATAGLFALSAVAGIAFRRFRRN